MEVPPAGRSGRLKMEVYPGGALDEEVELEAPSSASINAIRKNEKCILFQKV